MLRGGVPLPEMSFHVISAITEMCAGGVGGPGNPLCAKNFAGTDCIYLNKASSLTLGKSRMCGETLPNKNS